jgi:hypothetical protein
MQENSPCPPVPRFGEWDQKGPIRDYSMDFSKIQEARKQQKSLGNEEELKASFRHIQRQRTEHDASPIVRFLVTFVIRYSIYLLISDEHTVLIFNYLLPKIIKSYFENIRQDKSNNILYTIICLYILVRNYD